jgi:hypothetical protein
VRRRIGGQLQVVIGTCDASLVWIENDCDCRRLALQRVSRERAQYLSIDRSRQRAAAAGSWPVNAVALWQLAVSDTTVPREGETTAEEQVQAPAPAAHRQQLPVAQGPLKIMERQAGRQARATRAPDWGWMTWMTNTRKASMR